MNREDLWSKFESLLQEECLLSKYRINAEKCGRISGKAKIAFSLHPASWLDCAFNWSETAEGHDLWDEIQDKWFKILREE